MAIPIYKRTALSNRSWQRGLPRASPTSSAAGVPWPAIGSPPIPHRFRRGAPRPVAPADGFSTEHKRTAFLSILLAVCATQTFAESERTQPGELNAAPIYRRAGSLLRQLPDDFQQRANAIIENGWQDKDEDLKALLNVNQDAIQEFLGATRLAECQFVTPGAQKDYTTPSPDYTKEVSVAKLALMQGRLYEREQNFDATQERYLAVLRFAHHLGGQRESILLGKLMEIIVRRLVLAPLAEYVQRGRFDADRGQHLLKSLLSLHEQQKGLEGAFREERELRQNTLRRMFEEKAKQTGRYDKTFYQALYRALDALEEEYAGYLLAGVKANNLEAYVEKLGQLKREVKREAGSLQVKLEMLVTGKKPPTLVAKMLIVSSMPPDERVVSRYYVFRTELSVVIVGTAMKLFELQNGRSPERLEELVPRYLPEVPQDPFNNWQPLRYAKGVTGWVVYSFGPDRQDNQGKQRYQESPSKTGDIVFISSSVQERETREEVRR